MTKKLEEFFNLPSQSADDESEDMEIIEPTRTREELLADAQEIKSSITTAERVDYALPTVVGLDNHDSEMDDIATKAVRTFDDLIALGGNVPDMHAGKIYEVAGQMLKTALEAKNAKAEKKLRMIELQLKKIRSEQIDFENGQGGKTNPTGGEFDRNELLRYMIGNQKSEKSDK